MDKVPVLLQLPLSLARGALTRHHSRTAVSGRNTGTTGPGSDRGVPLWGAAFRQALAQPLHMSVCLDPENEKGALILFQFHSGVHVSHGLAVHWAWPWAGPLGQALCTAHFPGTHLETEKGSGMGVGKRPLLTAEQGCRARRDGADTVAVSV